MANAKMELIEPLDLLLGSTGRIVSETEDPTSVLPTELYTLRDRERVSFKIIPGAVREVRRWYTQ